MGCKLVSLTDMVQDQHNVRTDRPRDDGNNLKLSIRPQLVFS